MIGELISYFLVSWGIYMILTTPQVHGYRWVAAVMIIVMAAKLVLDVRAVLHALKERNRAA